MQSFAFAKLETILDFEVTTLREIYPYNLALSGKTIIRIFLAINLVFKIKQYMIYLIAKSIKKTSKISEFRRHNLTRLKVENNVSRDAGQCFIPNAKCHLHTFGEKPHTFKS